MRRTLLAGATLVCGFVFAPSAGIADTAKLFNVASGEALSFGGVEGIGYGYTEDGQRKSLIVKFEDGDKFRFDPDYWSWVIVPAELPVDTKVSE